MEDRLEQELNILVNKPKQNFGNSNDGNTSRKFFENLDVVAEITGKETVPCYQISTHYQIHTCTPKRILIHTQHRTLAQMHINQYTHLI